MRFGDLRHSVTIKRDASTRGASGGLAEWTTPVEVATVFGHLRATGQAREGASSPDWPVSVSDHRWTIHNRTDLTPAMRIYFGARTFEIVAVPAVPGETFLELPCREIV